MSPKYVLHLSTKQYCKGKFIVLKFYSPNEFPSFSGFNKSQKPDETGWSHSEIILRISSIWQANFTSAILTLSLANLLPTPSAKVKNFSVLIQWKKHQNLSHKRRIEWILYLSLDISFSLYDFRFFRPTCQCCHRSHWALFSFFASFAHCFNVVF